MEIPIEKPGPFLAVEPPDEPVEVRFEPVPVTGKRRERLKEAIAKIRKVSPHRRCVELGPLVTERVVETVVSLDLEPVEKTDRLPVEGLHVIGKAAALPDHFVPGGEGLVAQVRLQVETAICSFGEDLRYGQTERTEVAGEAEEGGVLVVVVVGDADNRSAAAADPEDPAVRPVLPDRLDRIDIASECLLKQGVQFAVHLLVPGLP